MPINRKTGKTKDIAFILFPYHVHNKVHKFNGIRFYKKSLILEEAMFTRKKCEQQRQRQYHKRPQVVVENFPENQDKKILLDFHLPKKLFLFSSMKAL